MKRWLEYINLCILTFFKIKGEKNERICNRNVKYM
ncbi:unknown [Coprobacillus sp. CAG:698]|nr:unknown [Coprobacillus sp. CAG:698]